MKKTTQGVLIKHATSLNTPFLTGCKHRKPGHMVYKYLMLLF